MTDKYTINKSATTGHFHVYSLDPTFPMGGYHFGTIFHQPDATLVCNLLNEHYTKTNRKEKKQKINKKNKKTTTRG